MMFRFRFRRAVLVWAASAFVFMLYLSCIVLAEQPIKVFQLPHPSELSKASALLLPRSDAPSIEQIREYLRLSHDLDSFRASWIAAFDKNRSVGAPYWPQSFYTDAKLEMHKADLLPMFISLYQHGTSKQILQDALNGYSKLGADHFKGSPACFQLGQAWVVMEADMDKLKLAETSDVLIKVYDQHKTEIKAARAKYIQEHPGWKD